MKKYLLGVFAIALAIGFSAFTTSKVHSAKTSTTFYWFEAAQNTGSQSTFVDADVSYIQASASAPTGICSGTQTYKCVLGFTASQVDLTDPDNPIIVSSQAPAQLGEKRPTQ